MDVVIPVHEKDYPTLPWCVESVKRHLDVGRVYLVSGDPVPECVLDPGVHGAYVTWVREGGPAFPFDAPGIEALLPEEHRGQAGWYLQQLIKLYAGLCIPGLSGRYLTIDSDTIVMRPFALQTPGGLPVFSTSDEHHEPYFRAMARLHPSLGRCMDRSAICHYMVMDTWVCGRLISDVEALHGGRPFCELYASNAYEHRNCMSEFEIYLAYHRGVLGLPSEVVSYPFENRSDLSEAPAYAGDAYYVSYHAYIGRYLVVPAGGDDVLLLRY